MQEYIDLGWHTVPLGGVLERLEDGSKTVPQFEKGWQVKYQGYFNKNATPLGGTMTGEVSGIIAIDCDNENTWKLFRALDPSYEFIFLSKGKGFSAGTIIYAYDKELSEGFQVHNGDMDLDFYSDRGFIYLATKANKTKATLTAPLPEIRPAPPAVKMLLKQIQLSTQKAAPREVSSGNLLTARCVYPTLKQFIDKGDFMPGLFRIITPRDFRTLPDYVKQGYLHPNQVPDGRGSEYLSKISAILGSDISVDKEAYVSAIQAINALFDSPMDPTRLHRTIMDPMLEENAAVDGKIIWQYDENWSKHRVILHSKRQTTVELAFEAQRNIYYIVDEANLDIKAFGRDSDMMAYLESIAVSVPKKAEVKRAIPLANAHSLPSVPFGFSEGTDPTARMLNTFVQTPYLAVFNNPDLYVQDYKRPETILKYMDSLVPDVKMRSYLLKFVKTKLSTFNYSPVVLYFMGAHGSGKDMFVGILETILGHVARPTTKEFLEMFNGWAVDSYFVQLDEFGNQLTNVRDREEALGKIKAYSGKPTIQIRQMRTDGFQYNHRFTFIMTANKNPLMLEEGDRRIAFFATPNKLTELDWVKEAGGIANVFNQVQAEIKDFCYYLATEVPALSNSEYVTPPESIDKDVLIADSMYPAQRIAYVLKHSMLDYLIDLAEQHAVIGIDTAIAARHLTLTELNELYAEMTDGNGDPKALLKTLKAMNIPLAMANSDYARTYRVEIEKL